MSSGDTTNIDIAIGMLGYRTDEQIADYTGLMLSRVKSLRATRDSGIRRAARTAAAKPIGDSAEARANKTARAGSDALLRRQIETCQHQLSPARYATLARRLGIATRRSPAWFEGQASAEKPAGANPYALGSANSRDWSKGHRAGSVG